MPTIIILIVLIGIISLSIRKIRKDRAAGMGWTGCAVSNSCNSKKKDN